MSSAPSAPTLPAAPTFAGTQIYDSSGNLTGSITKDANGNIVYQAGALSAADQVNQKAVTAESQSLLQQLAKNPAEWQAASDKSAAAWAANQNKAQSDQFNQDVNQIGATSNMRGLSGSKAEADILSQREKTLSDASTSIANDASAMSQGLMNNQISQTEGIYGLYANAAQNYTNNSMNNLQAAGGLSNSINSFNSNSYNSTVNALNSQYQNQLSSWSNNDVWKNYVMPLAATAAVAAPKLSDRRLKRNIVPIFKTGDVQWYSFEYDLAKFPEGVLLPQEGQCIGVMADEVKDIPGAFCPEMFYGFDMVNYEAVRRHIKMENA